MTRFCPLRALSRRSWVTVVGIPGYPGIPTSPTRNGCPGAGLASRFGSLVGGHRNPVAVVGHGSLAWDECVSYPSPIPALRSPLARAVICGGRAQQWRTLTGRHGLRHHLDGGAGRDAGHHRRGHRRGVAAKRREPLVCGPWRCWAFGVLQAVAGILRHRFAVTTGSPRPTAPSRSSPGRRSVSAPPCRARSPPARSSRSAPPTWPTSATRSTSPPGPPARWSSFFVVAAILLSTSVTLGLIVLIGVPVLMLLRRPDAPAAAATAARTSAPDGRADQHRLRHRRRAAGAARHRRRGGLPRPLPPRVADRSGAPESGWPGSSPCWTRCRSCCPASSWCS